MIARVWHLALVTCASVAVSKAAVSPPSKFEIVNGARLEYLDWGGSGTPLLFLAGLGGTAHIFDDLAPEFTASHRCLALTRRGFGKSEQTADGYTLENLALDIFTFANNLGLQNLTLVGHSYGGTEAIRAAELYPGLVRRVILLDTAYDTIPPDAPEAEEKLFTAFTGIAAAERLSSVDVFRAYEKRLMGNVWSDAAEDDMRETIIIAADGSIKSRSPGRIGGAIAGERAKGKWRITKIPVPALMIFAHYPWTEMLPNAVLDAQTIAVIKKQGAELEAARRSQIEAFRRDTPQASIVEMDHTVHHCFLQRQERIVGEMRQFLDDSVNRKKQR